MSNSNEKQFFTGEDLKEAYLNGWDEALKFSWISVKERLPELKKRVHDKYQAKLLEIAIPDILADDIFSNTLKVTSYLGKQVKKKIFDLRFI